MDHRPPREWWNLFPLLDGDPKREQGCLGEGPFSKAQGIYPRGAADSVMGVHAEPDMSVGNLPHATLPRVNAEYLRISTYPPTYKKIVGDGGRQTIRGVCDLLVDNKIITSCIMFRAIMYTGDRKR